MQFLVRNVCSNNGGDGADEEDLDAPPPQVVFPPSFCLLAQLSAHLPQQLNLILHDLGITSSGATCRLIWAASGATWSGSVPPHTAGYTVHADIPSLGDYWSRRLRGEVSAYGWVGLRQCVFYFIYGIQVIMLVDAWQVRCKHWWRRHGVGNVRGWSYVSHRILQSAVITIYFLMAIKNI